MTKDWGPSKETSPMRILRDYVLAGCVAGIAIGLLAGAIGGQTAPELFANVLLSGSCCGLLFGVVPGIRLLWAGRF